MLPRPVAGHNVNRKPFCVPFARYNSIINELIFRSLLWENLIIPFFLCCFQVVSFGRARLLFLGERYSTTIEATVVGGVIKFHAPQLIHYSRTKLISRQLSDLTFSVSGGNLFRWCSSLPNFPCIHCLIAQWVSTSCRRVFTPLSSLLELKLCLFINIEEKQTEKTHDKWLNVDFSSHHWYRRIIIILRCIHNNYDK